MKMLPYLLVALAGYLCGAMPFAYILARLKGVDIRKVGSGNVGATNVFRSVSKGLGILTFVADALKGFLPAWLLPLCAVRWLDVPAGPGLGLLGGCAAVAGHTWPVFLKFKGGKGVATSAGMLLGVAPAAMGIGLAAWILLFAATRYVSVASMAAAAATPGAAWWLYGASDRLRPAVLTVLGLIIVLRHRANIGRLLKGTELRMGSKSRAASGAE